MSTNENGSSQNPEADAGERDSGRSPTNDRSFTLLFKDDLTRFAIFQYLFGQSGKACNPVTKATFEGGFDGTDEWKVDCGDSGTWQVWFKPEGRIDFDQCSKSRCA